MMIIRVGKNLKCNKEHICTFAYFDPFQKQISRNTSLLIYKVCIESCRLYFRFNFWRELHIEILTLTLSVWSIFYLSGLMKLYLKFEFKCYSIARCFCFQIETVIRVTIFYFGYFTYAHNFFFSNSSEIHKNLQCNHPLRLRPTQTHTTHARNVPKFSGVTVAQRVGTTG